jgi:hypothetical protein
MSQLHITCPGRSRAMWEVIGNEGAGQRNLSISPQCQSREPQEGCVCLQSIWTYILEFSSDSTLLKGARAVLVSSLNSHMNFSGHPECV